MTKPAYLTTRALSDLCFNVWLLAFFPGFFTQPFFFAFAARAFFFAGFFGRDLPKDPAYNLPRFVRRSPLPIRLFLVL
jgi:hypothetical protein